MIIKIETPNLIVRPFEPSDASIIFLLSQESGMKEWIPDQVYEDEKEAEEVLEYLISQYEKGQKPNEAPIVYAVALKETGEVIGHVGLSPYEDACEAGYAIAEKYWGRGYATEAVSAYARRFTEQLEFLKIYGIVAGQNIASAKVLEKSGFTFMEEKEQMHHGKSRLCRRYCF